MTNLSPAAEALLRHLRETRARFTAALEEDEHDKHATNELDELKYELPAAGLRHGQVVTLDGQTYRLRLEEYSYPDLEALNVSAYTLPERGGTRLQVIDTRMAFEFLYVTDEENLSFEGTPAAGRALWTVRAERGQATRHQTFTLPAQVLPMGGHPDVERAVRLACAHLDRQPPEAGERRRASMPLSRAQVSERPF